MSRPQGKFLYDLKDMSYSASNDGLAEWMLSVILLTGPFISLAQSVVTKLILKKAEKLLAFTTIGLIIGCVIYATMLYLASCYFYILATGFC